MENLKSSFHDCCFLWQSAPLTLEQPGFFPPGIWNCGPAGFGQLLRPGRCRSWLDTACLEAVTHLPNAQDLNSNSKLLSQQFSPLGWDWEKVSGTEQCCENKVGLLQGAFNLLLRQVLNVFHVISNVLFIELMFFLYVAFVFMVNSLENYSISVWCYLLHHHLFCANIMTLGRKCIYVGVLHYWTCFPRLQVIFSLNSFKES